MYGLLNTEGFTPAPVLQSVPVGSRDAARVLKKLHLFSAGRQKGSEFSARHKWCIHASRQRVLQPKVTFPRCSSPSFCCPPSFATVFFSLSDIRNTESLLCHYSQHTDGRRAPSGRTNLREWSHRVKSQSFHLWLVIFFIMISVLMNPTREHGNGTSF